MNTSTAGHPHDGGWYEIRLQGRLAPRWSDWFDGLTLTAADDGTTTLRGRVADQAALHGQLQRLRDLGLPLISVTQVEPGPAPDNTAPDNTAPGNTAPDPAAHDHNQGDPS